MAVVLFLKDGVYENTRGRYKNVISSSPYVGHALPWQCVRASRLRGVIAPCPSTRP